MASEKKLPAVFYALMFAAIAVALVLIVGIIMEKKNEAPFPVATATPAVSASPSEALAKTCTLKEVSLAPDLEFMKSARLVGWGAEPFQLTLWVLDRSKDESPVAKKLTLSNLQADSAKAEVTSQQSLACEGFQKAGCLYLASSETNGTKTPADTITDLSLERDLGLLTLSNDPKNSRAVVARVENGKLMFHETLGLCGESLQSANENLYSTTQGSDEARSLTVFDKTLGGVFLYSNIGANSYSRIEAPLHPSLSQIANSQGLKPVDCKQSRVESGADTKRYAFRNLNSTRSGDYSRVALIASGRKTFDSDQEVWVIETSKSEPQLLTQLTSQKLGVTPGDLMWLSPESLLVSSSNFFQTKTTFKGVRFPNVEVVPSDFADGWPGPNSQTREALTQESVLQESQPLFVFKDSKKTAGAMKFGDSVLNLPGSFAPEETPRVLISKRGDSDWLVIYQGTTQEPIRAARVQCSL